MRDPHFTICKALAQYLSYLMHKALALHFLGEET